MGKKRIDQLLVERGLANSREKAQALVLAGCVTVQGQVALKPGTSVSEVALLEVRDSPPFVGRGGVKLAAALDEFGIEVRGRVALDVGASTGGFTDVLLQREAQRVYAVDVGYGQLDLRLRGDTRVVVMERVNIRHLQELPERPSLGVVDVSFISLRLVLPVVIRLLDDISDIVALVKPQFEAGRSRVGRGVVRSSEVWGEVLRGFVDWTPSLGWGVSNLMVSPLRGAAGNVEFLAHLVPGARTDDSEGLVVGALLAARART